MKKSVLLFVLLALLALFTSTHASATCASPGFRVQNGGTAGGGAAKAGLNTNASCSIFVDSISASLVQESGSSTAATLAVWSNGTCTGTEDFDLIVIGVTSTSGDTAQWNSPPGFQLTAGSGNICVGFLSTTLTGTSTSVNVMGHLD